MKETALKVGLFVEDIEPTNEKEKQKLKTQFYEAIENAKNSDIDLLVFPEVCYWPVEDFGSKKISEIALEISKLCQKAVIVGFCGEDKGIYDVYANAFNKENETNVEYYIKHIFTENSAFNDENYGSECEDYFPIINLKGVRIGMTICYDLTQPVFSRMYGKKGVDIIINTTGSDVNRRKWCNYLKTRAIENNCFSLCVDGYSIEKRIYNEKTEQGVIATGYNSKGEKLSVKSLKTGREIQDNECERNNIYIIDFTTSIKQDEYKSIPEEATIPKFEDLKLPASNIQSTLNSCKEIAQGLYVEKKRIGEETYTLVYCVVDDEEIFKPEILLSKLYNSVLGSYKNKRYFAVCKYGRFDQKTFETIITPVLGARTTENYITLLFESEVRNLCLQVTRTKGIQLVENVGGYYRIDIDRAKGPDHLWKKKNSIKMSSDWKDSFKKLVDYTCK